MLWRYDTGQTIYAQLESPDIVMVAIYDDACFVGEAGYQDRLTGQIVYRQSIEPVLLNASVFEEHLGMGRVYRHNAMNNVRRHVAGHKTYGADMGLDPVNGKSIEFIGLEVVVSEQG